MAVDGQLSITANNWTEYRSLSQLYTSDRRLGCKSIVFHYRPPTHCPPTARPLPAHWQLDNRWLMAALAKKNIHDDEANRRGNDDDSHHSGIVMQAMESMAPLLHFPAPLIDWWSQRRQVATSRFAVLTQRSQSPLICSCYTSKLRNYRPPMRNKHQHKRNKNNNNNNNSNNKNNTQTNKKMKWNQVARYRLLC